MNVLLQPKLQCPSLHPVQASSHSTRQANIFALNGPELISSLEDPSSQVAHFPCTVNGKLVVPLLRSVLSAAEKSEGYMYVVSTLLSFQQQCIQFPLITKVSNWWGGEPDIQA